MDRTELERMDREGLVLRAQAAGIRRARVLTRPELIDELLRLDPVIDETQLKKTRGFFGRARDLLSRVVERGLHLPDAADRLRVGLGNPVSEIPRPESQAVPTVTLAEIYAAQGHKQRAIETLRRVLEIEPEHGAARSLLEKLEAADYVSPAPPLPPEPEVEEAQRLQNAISVDAGLDAPEPAPATLGVAEPPTSSLAPRPKEKDTEARESRRAECVAIRVARRDTYVWWRLAPDQTVPVGSFIVRAVILTPTWDGPDQHIDDTPCDSDAGELLLRDLPEHAVVRVAVGYLEDDTFTPVAHSPALETTPRRGLVRWTVEGSIPVALDDPSIAFAAEKAARVAG